jgi:hypothetical protein
MDSNTITNIHLALDDDVLLSVAEKKTIRKIWVTLTKLYDSKYLHNNIFLKIRLYTLQMVETTTMIDHINTIRTLFSQLTMLGQQIEENECAKLLLQSQLDLYDQLIINLTNNILIDYLVFDDVAIAILKKENRRRNKENKINSSHQTKALLMLRERSMGRGSSRSQMQEWSKSRSKKIEKCYNCGRKEHYKRDYWYKKNHESSKPQGCVANTLNYDEVL